MDFDDLSNELNLPLEGSGVLLDSSAIIQRLDVFIDQIQSKGDYAGLGAALDISTSNVNSFLEDIGLAPVDEKALSQALHLSPLMAEDELLHEANKMMNPVICNGQDLVSLLPKNTVAQYIAHKSNDLVNVAKKYADPAVADKIKTLIEASENIVTQNLISPGPTNPMPTHTYSQETLWQAQLLGYPAADELITSVQQNGMALSDEGAVVLNEKGFYKLFDVVIDKLAPTTINHILKITEKLDSFGEAVSILQSGGLIVLDQQQVADIKSSAEQYLNYESRVDADFLDEVILGALYKNLNHLK